VTNVLGRAAQATLELDPFPHLLIDDALESEVYARLVAQFPSLDVVNGHAHAKNNRLYLMSARDVDACSSISAEWKAFFRFHASSAFWRTALPLICTQLLAINPRLEEMAGRALEDFRVAVRRRDAPFAEEISLDCQFGVNSPVLRASSVRTPHVDRPSKLFNALLYCRAGDDDTPGGELVLYRATAPIRYAHGSSVLASRIVPAKRIAYRANRLVLFLNSPWAVHAVSPRPKTPHVRRYINIPCEFRRELFDVERAPRWLRYFDDVVASLRGPSAPAVVV
jgi:hypothetical protein